jgi:Thymidylate synthase complementing protein
MIEAKNVQILLDSKNAVTEDRITTVILKRFPYALIQEISTHRMLHGDLLTEPWTPFPVDLSRNSASMRAIPIKKVIERIQDDPYIPSWTAANKGMVGLDTLTEQDKSRANIRWLTALDSAISEVEYYENLGIAKQDANRALQRFMRIPIIITATEWNPFFKLRTAPDVQPDFRSTAIELQESMAQSVPQILQIGEWHIPFGDRLPDGIDLQAKLKVSAARCARISYSTHDGNIDIAKDVDLCDRLVADGHFSPLEHQAQAVAHSSYMDSDRDTRNFKGFYHFRAQLEDGFLGDRG